ncbi:MAG: SGNH/GDSL hydrolase family protein [Clostridia bacterium]|nr:SGNH/GDSL hydrolase family protein [Clostridia bacterium]
MDKKYNNLEKNTVSAQNQLENSEFVRFSNQQPNGIKILFVGNSITLHGVKEDIGWFNEHGMAASCIENDYVHKTIEMLSKTYPKIGFCICQAAEWECNYKEGDSMLEPYKRAREFDADIIIMRLGENCPKDNFDNVVFEEQYAKLVSFFNPKGNARVILTTGFWYHPFDEPVIDYAKKANLPVVTLGDLGEQDEMKATGLFWHSGVAHHPSDLGMLSIAKRIVDCILEN